MTPHVRTDVVQSASFNASRLTARPRLLIRNCNTAIPRSTSPCVYPPACHVELERAHAVGRPAGGGHRGVGRSVSGRSLPSTAASPNGARPVLLSSRLVRQRGHLHDEVENRADLIPRATLEHHGVVACPFLSIECLDTARPGPHRFPRGLHRTVQGFPEQGVTCVRRRTELVEQTGDGLTNRGLGRCRHLRTPGLQSAQHGPAARSVRPRRVHAIAYKPALLATIEGWAEEKMRSRAHSHQTGEVDLGIVDLVQPTTPQ